MTPKNVSDAVDALKYAKPARRNSGTGIFLTVQDASDVSGALVSAAERLSEPERMFQSTMSYRMSLMTRFSMRAPAEG